MTASLDCSGKYIKRIGFYIIMNNNTNNTNGYDGFGFGH